jgi:hypothetical protein
MVLAGTSAALPARYVSYDVQPSRGNRTCAVRTVRTLGIHRIDTGLERAPCAAQPGIAVDRFARDRAFFDAIVKCQ